MHYYSVDVVAELFVVFVTLFIAIWVPCCVSDIVFPLLFVRSDIELERACPNHRYHSHPHSDGNGVKS